MTVVLSEDEQRAPLLPVLMLSRAALYHEPTQHCPTDWSGEEAPTLPTLLPSQPIGYHVKIF